MYVPCLLNLAIGNHRINTNHPPLETRQNKSRFIGKVYKMTHNKVRNTKPRAKFQCLFYFYLALLVVVEANEFATKRSKVCEVGIQTTKDCTKARDDIFKNGGNTCGKAKNPSQINQKNRPKGCFCRSNKLYFNINKKSTSTCSSSNVCLCKRKPIPKAANKTCSFRYLAGGENYSAKVHNVRPGYMDCECCIEGKCTPGNFCGVPFFVYFYSFLYVLGGLGFIRLTYSKYSDFVSDHVLKKGSENGMYMHKSDSENWLEKGVSKIIVKSQGEITKACKFVNVRSDTTIFKHGSFMGGNSQVEYLKDEEYIQCVKQCAEEIVFITNLGEEKKFNWKSSSQHERIYTALSGSMIVGLQIAVPENGKTLECIGVIQKPYVRVYASIPNVSKTVKHKKNCKFIYTTTLELLVIILDIISLVFLWNSFASSHSGYLTISSGVEARDISECVSNWESIVKPCLEQRPNANGLLPPPVGECALGQIKNTTAMTFSYTNQYLNASNDPYNISATITIMMPIAYNPERAFQFEPVSRVAQLAIQPSHKYCINFRDLRESRVIMALIFLSVFKLLHIALEIYLLVKEIWKETGIVAESHHKDPCCVHLMGKGLKSLITLLITLPANYMYAALLSLGYAITANTPTGDPTFLGPGIWKTPSTMFLTASFYGVIGWGAGFPLLHFSHYCCTKWCTCLSVKIFERTGMSPVQVGLIAWFMVPFLTFVTFMFIDLYQQNLYKTLSFYNLFFSINMPTFGTFNVAGGILVSLSGLRLTSNTFRYLALLGHLHPKNVIYVCKQLKGVKASSAKLISIAEEAQDGMPEVLENGKNIELTDIDLDVDGMVGNIKLSDAEQTVLKKYFELNISNVAGNIEILDLGEMCIDPPSSDQIVESVKQISTKMLEYKAKKDEFQDETLDPLENETLKGEGTVDRIENKRDFLDERLEESEFLPDGSGDKENKKGMDKAEKKKIVYHAVKIPEGKSAGDFIVIHTRDGYEMLFVPDGKKAGDIIYIGPKIDYEDLGPPIHADYRPYQESLDWIPDISNTKEDAPNVQPFFFTCTIPENTLPGSYLYVEVPQGVVKFIIKEGSKPGDKVEAVGDLHLLR